jgi:RNA-directed DNA polymerase
VNQSLNIARPEFDRLKATLTNCLRTTTEAQNREVHPDFRAHLEGRLSFFESVKARKAKRPRKIFNQIQWPVL